MICEKDYVCSEKIKNRLINDEQKHQIEIHKWLTSEKCGYDRGNEAIREWIVSYSKLFREWAETLPFECIGCQCCKDSQEGEMCKQPFNEDRIKVIGKNTAQ